jgi:predicted RNA-binding protein associated with RNAse of E/G family
VVANWPTKFLVFDLEGNYLKTLETGYKICNICYDKKENRILMSLDDQIQFASLELDGLLD